MTDLAVVLVLAIAALIGIYINRLPDDIDDCPTRRDTDKDNPR